jgi:hypothetical protein
VATGTEIGSFMSEGFPEFLPNGQGLALCNHDGVRLCDLATGREYQVPHIYPHIGTVDICRAIYKALYAMPKTELLAVRTRRPPTSDFLRQYGALLGIKWWSHRGYDEDLAFVNTRTGETVASMPWSNFIEPLISPDGKALALYSSESDEAVIELWDTPPRKPLRWVLGLLAIPSVVTVITLMRIRRRFFRSHDRQGVVRETAS